MDDLAKLGLVIETGDVADALRELEALRKKMAENDAQGKKFNNTTKETNSILSSLGRVASTVAAALSINQVVTYANTWSDLNGRLLNVTKSQEAADAALEAISQTARNTYSSLEQTAEAFLNNAQTLTELGYATERQLVLSDALNNGLVISGVAGQRAESVMMALSRALANGTLRGEEFNTIVQSGGRITQALADGLGVSTLELRGLAEKGLLTTGKVFEAITSQSEKLAKEAGAMAVTIRDGFVTLNSSLLTTVGRFNDTTGAGEYLGERLVDISDALKSIDPDEVLGLLNSYMDEAAVIAGGLATVYVARLFPAIITTSGGLIAQTSAVLANARAMGVATVAANGLRGAMALLGGPAGVVFIAATALAAYAINSTTAADATDLLNQELDNLSKTQAIANTYKVKDAIEELEGQIEKTRNVMEQSSDAYQAGITMGADVEATSRAYAEASAKLEEQNATLDKYKAQLSELQGIIDGTRSKTEQKTTAVGQLSTAVDIADKNFVKLSESLTNEIIQLSLSEEAYERHNANVLLGADATDQEREAIEQLITSVQRLRKEKEEDKNTKQVTSRFAELQLEISATADPAEEARQQLQARLDVVREYSELEGADREAALEAHFAAHQAFERRMTALTKQEADARKALQLQQADSTAAFFGQVAQLAQDAGKEQFETYKAASIVQAVIGTYSSAVKAYDSLSGIPYVGPVLGAAAAAAAVAFGLQQVSAIRSQQYTPRAVGGQVMAGNTYQVNERGVELFTPSSAGKITPFSQLMTEARQGTDNSTPSNVELNLIVQAQDTNGLEEWAVNNRDLFYNMVVQAMNERGRSL